MSSPAMRIRETTPPTTPPVILPRGTVDDGLGWSEGSGSAGNEEVDEGELDALERFPRAIVREKISDSLLSFQPPIGSLTLAFPEELHHYQI